MAEQRHATMSKQTTDTTIAPVTAGCVTIVAQVAANNSKQTQMSNTLTCVEYGCIIREEGENHAPYGAATHRMANRRGYCGGIGGEAKLSTGVDTVQEVNRLQVWQTPEGQTGRSGEVYRKQQTAVAKRKASSELADNDIDPPWFADRLRGP